MTKNAPKIMAAALAITALAAGLGEGAHAQAKKQANPFQGFSSDNGKPVDIKSESLEVYQNDQKAIFIGSVVATQGESVLKTPRLVVYYDNEGKAAEDGKPAADPAKPVPAPAPAPATPAAPGAPGETSAIKRLEASGGVVVTAADQKATGADGVFDMESNTAVLTGDVVLTQGANVIRGKKLTVDLKTGVARVGGGTSGIFVPSQNKPKSN